LQSIFFLCDSLSWQAQEEAEALEAAAQGVAQGVAHEVAHEVAQEVEVSEAADQEVEQEAEAEEAEEAEGRRSVNGARTENSTVLDWLKMAKKMSMSFILGSAT
jgi:hypothetical protein